MTDTRPPTTPGAPRPGAAAPAGADPTDDIGYADALDELEAILDELDGDEVDVDVLGARVRRAAELLRLCRSRIAGARFEVEQVVSELEAEAEAAGVAGGAEPGGASGVDDDDPDGDDPDGDVDDDADDELAGDVHDDADDLAGDDLDGDVLADGES